MMSGARERLSPAVEHALAYAHGAVSHIPAGIELTPDNWGRTPLLRAFSRARAMSARRSRQSQDLRDFMKSPAASGMETLHCVVAATRVERTVLGHAMEGEMLRQDVAQRTVSFSDMRIAGFTATEDVLRAGLEDFVLEQLVLAALRDVAENRQRSDQRRPIASCCRRA